MAAADDDGLWLWPTGIELLSAGIGPIADVRFAVLLLLQVKTIRPWTMSGRVASSYQKGRVFLVGDAAHHFPPSGT